MVYKTGCTIGDRRKRKQPNKKREMGGVKRLPTTGNEKNQKIIERKKIGEKMRTMTGLFDVGAAWAHHENRMFSGSLLETCGVMIIGYAARPCRPPIDRITQDIKLHSHCQSIITTIRPFLLFAFFFCAPFFRLSLHLYFSFIK